MELQARQPAEARLTKVLEENRESQGRRTKRMLTTVDHIHGVVSDMIRRFRPAGLDELGLSAAVESCVEQWQQRPPATRFSFSACRSDAAEWD